MRQTAHIDNPIQPGQAPVGTQPTGRLLSLEIGRFIAALVVLLYHYTSVVQDVSGTLVLADIFRPGHAGVPYFFVLSGFVIFHAHRRDVGRPGRIPHFLLRRAIRLYPMFWLISAVMLAGFLLVPALAGQRAITPAGVLLDLALMPHADAILSISWSLRHEIIFYLLFLGVIAWGLRGVAGIVLWITGSFIAALLIPSAGTLGWGSILVSPLNLGFGLGLAVAIGTGHAWPKPIARVSVCMGLVLLALTWALEWTWGRGTPHSMTVLGIGGDLSYMIGSALMIAGLAWLEPGWVWRNPLIWQRLGGASYTLYLIHQPLGSIGIRLMGALVVHHPLIAYVALSTGAVIAAVVVHMTIERWVLRHLQSMTAGMR